MSYSIYFYGLNPLCMF